MRYNLVTKDNNNNSNYIITRAYIFHRSNVYVCFVFFKFAYEMYNYNNINNVKKYNNRQVDN